MPVITMFEDENKRQQLFEDFDSLQFYFSGMFELMETPEEVKALYDGIHGIIFAERHIREAQLEKKVNVAATGFTDMQKAVNDA